MSRRRSPRTPAWYTRPATRLAFQRRLAACGQAVSTARPPQHLRGGYALAIHLRVPDLPEQTLTIVFGSAAPSVPRVFTDGPSASPHRYADGSLCMWYPKDPAEQRWTRADGAPALLGHIVAHLLREEWWRRTGEWAGAEAPHPTDPAPTRHSDLEGK